MKTPLRWLFNSIITVTLLLCCTVYAETNSRFADERQWFVEAEVALQKGDMPRYRELAKLLGDYPLYPYLERQRLEKNLSVSDEPAIAEFLQRYQGQRVASQLRSRWLRVLSEAKADSLLIKYYRGRPAISIQCRYLAARLDRNTVALARAKTQQPTPATDQTITDLNQTRSSLLSKTSDIWNSANSVTDACDPLFERWRSAGQLTHSIAYQRAVKIATGGQKSLLRYIKTVMARDEQYLADLWLRARTNPRVVHGKNFFPGKNPKESAIAVYALRRLAWDDRDFALRTWHQLDRMFEFNPTQLASIRRRFALALASVDHDKALEWFNLATTSAEDEQIWHWRLAYLLRRQNWQAVHELIENTPESFARKPQWRYWLARALTELGKTEQAAPIWQRVAKERDFYGFLASQRLGVLPTLGHRSIEPDQALLQKLRTMPTVERAQQWFLLGRYQDARGEWNRVSADLTGAQFQTLAWLANDWGWNAQAIFAAAKARFWDDVIVRFPLPHADLFQQYSESIGLPPQWTIAVSRQETAFVPDAISSAGAYGLMQVLPSTAKSYSKKFAIPYTNREQLLEPEYNIQFGTRYLKQRFDELDDNPILASASYNAGKHRVVKWLEYPAVDADIWIENIPFKETRGYVKNVMAYRVIYAMLLGKQDSVMADIAEMRIGSPLESARKMSQE